MSHFTTSLASLVLGGIIWTLLNFVTGKPFSMEQGMLAGVASILLQQAIDRDIIEKDKEPTK